MSECVVRMEFRKNCLDCDLHQIVYGDSYADTDVYCFKEKRFVGKRFGPIKDLARPSWCPIICSLPEGHGRLVDASVLKNKNMRKPRGVSSYDYGAMATVFMDTINDTPTIVPAEAKRKVDAHDAVAPTDTPTDTPTVAAERSET